MIEPTSPRASAIIVAGGTSRRMGYDKAFLEFDGKLLIERVLERVSQVCSEVLIVTNDNQAYARFGIPIVNDIFPGKGSLGGIYSGLTAAREPYALAVACDMPFLNVDLLRYLIALAPQSDVIVPRATDPSGNLRRGKPRLAGKQFAKEFDLHPTHAVYSKACLAPMRERLLADDLRIIGVYDYVRVLTVEADQIDQFDPRHLSFFNANTPEDLERARLLVG